MRIIGGADGYAQDYNAHRKRLNHSTLQEAPSGDCCMNYLEYIWYHTHLVHEYHRLDGITVSYLH